MNKIEEIREEISRYMPYEEFIRIQRRLSDLRGEEERKLLALAELQKAYVSATTDEARESVKQMVGRIRDLSRSARQEIRSLNLEICKYMGPDLAKELYERIREIEVQ